VAKLFSVILRFPRGHVSSSVLLLVRKLRKGGAGDSAFFGDMEKTAARPRLERCFPGSELFYGNSEKSRKKRKSGRRGCKGDCNEKMEDAGERVSSSGAKNPT